MKTRSILMFSVFVVATLACYWYATSNMKRASQAYVYGYPLVLMELTRITTIQGEPHPESGSNYFVHKQTFPDHTFRNVVRPNNDTLYSSSWLDLTEEPMVLQVPDTHDRYYVMPLMDAWTNVFATVGKRTHGTGAGNYLIVGPSWRGVVPSDVGVIKSPTNMVWIIGRIQTNGKSDVAKVAALQQKFSLTPLSLFLQGLVQPARANVNRSNHSMSDPYKQLKALSAVAYFNLLAELMSRQAAAESDAEMMAVLRSIGLIPGKNFAGNTINRVDRFLLGKAIEITHKRISEEIENGRQLENGWAVYRKAIGNYGNNYALRAAVAMVGLGALPPTEAAYPNTVVDSDQHFLSGVHQYRLRFEADKTPPADAFWSLTLYDERGFLTDNPINRYAVGDRDELVFNRDGSLDILIQHDSPKGESVNWLPSPKGDFALTLRIYSPRKPFLEGSWKLPPVEKI